MTPVNRIDAAGLARANQVLPRLLAPHDEWHIAGLRVFLQRYYYCIALEPNYAVGRHAHDWFELSQVQLGEVEYADSFRAHRLREGEVFFMSPGYEHSWRVARAPVVISSFQLKLAPLTDGARRLMGALDDLSHRHLFRFGKNKLRSRLSAEWAEAVLGAPSGGLVGEKLAAWFHLYLADFLDEAVGAVLPMAPAEAPEAADAAGRNSSRHISEFIGQNLHRPIQLEDIASHFHYSVRHINRLFQKEHGVSLGKYILEQKLKIAQRLLTTTDDPIKHVACSLGYVDVGYFCRLFRQHLNLTPTEYRTKLRIER